MFSRLDINIQGYSYCEDMRAAKIFICVFSVSIVCLLCTIISVHRLNVRIQDVGKNADLFQLFKWTLNFNDYGQVRIDSNSTNRSVKNFIIHPRHCKLSATTTPFIWTDTSSVKWYTVSYLKRIELSNPTYGTVEMAPEIISALKVNSRDSYKEYGKYVQKRDMSELKIWSELSGHPKYEARIATFRNVFVSSLGWIVSQQDCVGVRNGGCYTATPWSSPSTPVKSYERVISIGVYWGSGIWHFTMEAFVGLANYNLQKSDIIHVEAKTKWVMLWLKFLGVNSSQVIAGTIAANELIVPEMGRCGTPHIDQILWLRSIIPITVYSQSKSILLIKRTRKRVVKDFDKLQRKVEQFASEHNYKFVLHNDGSLPSLEIQLQRFSNASIVVGPHGAGMVNLIASKPKTCVVEFLPSTRHGINICYSRLSFLLGHNYFAVHMVENRINPDSVIDKMNICRTL